MREKERQAFFRQVHPAVFWSGIVVVVGLILWVFWLRTELRGATNPIGSPGNVDPYNSGSQPKMKSMPRPRAGGKGAGGPGAPAGGPR